MVVVQSLRGEISVILLSVSIVLPVEVNAAMPLSQI